MKGNVKKENISTRSVESHKPENQEWMTVRQTKCCAHCEGKRQNREYKHSSVECHNPVIQE